MLFLLHTPATLHLSTKKQKRGGVDPLDLFLSICSFSSVVVAAKYLLYLDMAAVYQDCQTSELSD
jgi:hypothetical protein